MSDPTGLLLINLGTPDAPETGAVRRYLREFLSDPRVIDIPALGRWALLHLVILPFRPARSAAAYRQIWTERGSPLLCHSRDLQQAVQARLGEGVKVVLAMRYGQPGIARGLAELRDAGCKRVIVMPQYPQYSSTTTGSSLEAVYREAAKLWNVPHLQVVEPYYDHPAYLRAMVAQARPVIERVRPERVVFSYHGLPERHLAKGDATGRHCRLDSTCCEHITAANRFCYRAHCLCTSRRLTEALGLRPETTLTTFQSRLGRTPWMQPYTDLAIGELARSGIKRVVVLCPAFTADCLESLEEIGMRAARDFRAQGGEILELVPSLNASEAWVEAVCELVAPHLSAARVPSRQA